MSSDSFAKVYNRLSFGLTPELEEQPLWSSYGEYAKWIEAQLHPQVEPHVEEQLKNLNFLYTQPDQLFADFDDGLGTPKISMGLFFEQLYRSHFQRNLSSRFPLQAVLSDFWFQHFNVDITKGDEKFVFPRYQQVIRENVFSTFDDLLMGCYTTSNMLHYLDNLSNFKDRINENFAREIFELHTVGREGGYSQQDIIELANMLTGWRCDFKHFYFDAEKHAGSQKTIFGYAPRGQFFAQGQDFFRHLATHDRTALFLCRKLATFFVAETPSPQLVEELAGVYKKTSGNLRDVYRHLFLNEDFYHGRFGAKAKRPLHFVLSSLRSVSASVQNSAALESWLTYMGELLFTNPNPGGYKDQSQMWLTADLALIRFQFVIDLVEGLIPGVQANVKDHRATIEKLSGPLFQMR